MCWLSCSPTALPEQDNPVSFQTSGLHHAIVYTGMGCLVWAILHGFLACRESLQSNSPSSQKIQEELHVPQDESSPPTDTKGAREDFQCHHRRCQPVTSSQRTPKQWAGAGSTPKIVFTLPCPRGRLPEQRVPRCLLLDVLYLTWQWAVPWQYPICSPLSRE